MNSTPRLRSAYPTTPQTSQKSPYQNGAPSSGHNAASNPQALSNSSSDDNGASLLPWIDAPTQRFYALAFYFGLNAWRFYDYYTLVANDVDSFWCFMKWVAMDGVFLFGLPGLRIPWLEWPFSTILAIFLSHALVNGLLMFRISLPLGSWMVGLFKLVYDSELAVSERRVKPASILHNSSLILGKQIINILPEGSAMLNPQQDSFCLGSLKSTINLPIRLNQTNPILIEILRFDLDTNQNETIVIPAKQAKRLKKQADRVHPKNDLASPRYLSYPIRKTGMYRLRKVVDESKLEVQRRMSDTLVVPCPKASIRPAKQDKCKGELSDLFLDVEGTPPLKIKYSRAGNREDRGFSFQSIQPENLDSPLVRQRTSGALITRDNIDLTWARSHLISVPLNESLSTSGTWMYSIDEVHDACGNVANYSRHDLDADHGSQRASHLQQIFNVHERPRAALKGCTPQHPLRVAKGQTVNLPVEYGSTGRGEIPGASHTLSYVFTPLEDMKSDGEHAPDALLESATVKNIHQSPGIRQPGLYTLKSIATQRCSGEVLEPTSCLLLNPPEPDLNIDTENIYDKCAGNSVGLLVDLDLIGTPPFTVIYNEQRVGDKQLFMRRVSVERLRGQLELTPSKAGRYIYHFLEVNDAVYKAHSVRHKDLILEQDVKPPASAHFLDLNSRMTACIEEPVSVNVKLQGEGPWALDYELVHGGRRSKYSIKEIESDTCTIMTDKLIDGGEYSLALTSVTDRSGCKIFLGEDAKIDVRRQRPKASFGQIEGKRMISSLELQKVKIPLRLTGEPPWTVQFRNTKDEAATPVEKIMQKNNDLLEVSDEGMYEIIDVHDASCPGSVDHSADAFAVEWIPRPSIKVAESALVERLGEKYIKKAVCEGDEDAVDISLSGTPPYTVKYEQRLKPEQGSVSLSNREFTAALGVASIRMETARAGQYEYKFSEVGDYLYDHDPRKYWPVVIQQRVHSTPSAKFVNSGKTYSYCMEEEGGDEVIPIVLTGDPPFSLEIGIKQQSTAKPLIMTFPHIESNKYDLRVNHGKLALGNHVVTVRKVSDARGCQRRTEFDASHVQVKVSSVPTISPLESQTDYCIGDHISYTLSGTQPFSVFYSFAGAERKAAVTTTEFRRIAEKPGTFTITAVSDGASGGCKAHTQITKIIHPMPSVRISKGRETVVDIQEGDEAEIVFDFSGTPPFEFTYTRSTNAQKGKKSQVLETRHDVSYGYTKSVRASQEGTYEVVAIKDSYCAFSKQRAGGKPGQKLLQF
ncbi:MAG: hypothetical protein M1835_002139 [Candelina submexicana]|nr:MAG: hypothetical protein M1835_002139 [Candelina submexicana]